MKSSKYIKWFFTDSVKKIFKKMSILNNLNFFKGTFLTQGEDELLAEMVRSYLCFYGKT